VVFIFLGFTASSAPVDPGQAFGGGQIFRGGTNRFTLV